MELWRKRLSTKVSVNENRVRISRRIREEILVPIRGYQILLVFINIKQIIYKNGVNKKIESIGHSLRFAINNFFYN